MKMGGGGGLGQEQHGVAVAVEAVALGYGGGVKAFDGLQPDKSGDEGDEGRFWQVKVREQHVREAEGVAGLDQERGIARGGGRGAGEDGVGGGFKGADGGSADDDDPAASPSGLTVLADGGGSGGGNGVVLGVHGMSFEGGGFDGEERAEADFEGDGKAADAETLDPGEEFGREMKAGGGGGQRGAVLGVDGLIAGAVEGFVGVRIGGAHLFNVRRQGDVADCRQQITPGAGVGSVEEPLAIFLGPRGDGEADGVGVAGNERIADLDLAAGAEHDQPLAGGLLLDEQAGDEGAGGFEQFELGGDDAGIVDDQQIGGEEIFGEIVEMTVLDFAGGDVIDQQAGVVARFNRPRGDAVGRQGVVELGSLHAGSVRFMGDGFQLSRAGYTRIRRMHLWETSGGLMRSRCWWVLAVGVLVGAAGAQAAERDEAELEKLRGKPAEKLTAEVEAAITQLDHAAFDKREAAERMLLGHPEAWKRIETVAAGNGEAASRARRLLEAWDLGVRGPIDPAALAIARKLLKSGDGDESNTGLLTDLMDLAAKSGDEMLVLRVIRTEREGDRLPELMALDLFTEHTRERVRKMLAAADTAAAFKLLERLMEISPPDGLVHDYAYLVGSGADWEKTLAPWQKRADEIVAHDRDAYNLPAKVVEWTYRLRGDTPRAIAALEKYNDHCQAARALAGDWERIAQPKEDDFVDGAGRGVDLIRQELAGRKSSVAGRAKAYTKNPPESEEGLKTILALVYCGYLAEAAEIAGQEPGNVAGGFEILASSGQWKEAVKLWDKSPRGEKSDESMLNLLRARGEFATARRRRGGNCSTRWRSPKRVTSRCC